MGDSICVNKTNLSYKLMLNIYKNISIKYFLKVQKHVYSICFVKNILNVMRDDFFNNFL